MLNKIIGLSLANKLIVLLFVLALIVFGSFSLLKIPIGAVPDVTNNQVQVITTSRDLSTQDVEQFITSQIEMELVNISGVKELRSISKFGLSVVTVVFDDDMGTYLPRQLIAEKLKSAAEKIPDGFGVPQMGPITTGLGEIYQYVLEVDPAYKDKYTTMDLRTLQDWVIKRQLSGVKGVVEINTWGGFLKQYEVQINPLRLRSLNLDIHSIYTALQTNNDIAGGGYIEKGGQAYFIRGEGLTKNIEDIKNIVVTQRNGIPVYIKDIAEVGLGHATRFGAVTGNGEGEKVLGQVMMLKDANSKAVIEAVKERIEQIQQNLPPGVSINPFLERSGLIAKTTFTIAENLILGCLIVIFVVVLLLGNLRTGLVIASVIPLSLLFALSCMYIFGVDANLMSLGAIDFGIIIDGAVIIVEFIAFQITSRSIELQSLTKADRKLQIDKVVQEGASRMMHSAVFGQLIILIVFIPILSLSNVEGKMFKPMALTFCFALVGAMLLCFTYVPVASAMFLKPSGKTFGFSTRLIESLKKIYKPLLENALKARKAVVAVAGVILVLVGLLFSRLGGEFVPTLDEGDFVIQPVLPSGTSLSETIKTITKIERIVGKFDEVEQVVTRIGAAEVPTDPMSMEETDVIITLKPPTEWEAASTKDQLANKIKTALMTEIEGVDYEFTQPIEMRFNELITGVRADLAIKIFGENLDTLAAKGDAVKNIILNVDGASDIIVEKIDGLPQMLVKYNRDRIAKYGLNISDVNQVVSAGFAGKVAGSIYEGERKFDLVVRYDKNHRKDIHNLKNSFVTTVSGQQVPLDQLADITYTTGPAKISRDNAKRRIVVSVNVRGRDLESVVDDVSKIIEQNIELPPGYYVEYGGQFENLQSARKRLYIAVPVALFLIFILLHFAFKSLKDALLIYTAIPLAAVGGVLFLWIRDIPFSISAGVGFIALFGIAVLNGIVLIEHYKELHQNGKYQSIDELIIHGTLSRLRPVLLTASAAALGFLPMAISTSAGAEVQRPLATVVIGGLITATLLTLFVLPALYRMFFKANLVKVSKPISMVILVVMMLTITSNSQAQQKIYSMEEAIKLAKEHNAGTQGASLRVNEQKALEHTAYEINKTDAYYSYDENNIAPNGEPLRVWGVQQSFEFPTVFSNKLKLNKAKTNLEVQQYSLALYKLEDRVSRSYMTVVYFTDLLDEYQQLDTIYSEFRKAAERKYELGESNALESLTAQSKQHQVNLKLNEIKQQLKGAYESLYAQVQSREIFLVADKSLKKLPLELVDSVNNPQLIVYNQQEKVIRQEIKWQQARFLPDFNFEYFRGTNSAPMSDIYSGFRVGIGIPLFYSAQKARVSQSKIRSEIISKEKEDLNIKLMAKKKRLLAKLESDKQSLEYYENTGNELAERLNKTAEISYLKGEIDYLQYIQILERVIEIRTGRIDALLDYNMTILSINYLTN
ncbi:CusA/CzcA family heavy metal efflux RND transporter [Fulvivirga lutimaris]|uniref:CusA/CzcA family heavy metal efflux RND transporter n=1 Tax=Fulvivirga lutimaris TaxID=1819566 RepID=UPI0012BD5426|nr:CusA/CzcA family heavy metal efflux RND transporter [Fulvivirga lutimaris]MTI40708.1 CusA/CzcA family heavy metal efflux RND transporter [Fulvivirga lutimaris]